MPRNQQSKDHGHFTTNSEGRGVRLYQLKGDPPHNFPTKD